jgi:hypothetical protein
MLQQSEQGTILDILDDATGYHPESGRPEIISQAGDEAEGSGLRIFWQVR